MIDKDEALDDYLQYVLSLIDNILLPYKLRGYKIYVDEFCWINIDLLEKIPKKTINEIEALFIDDLKNWSIGGDEINNSFYYYVSNNNLSIDAKMFNRVKGLKELLK